MQFFTIVSLLSIAQAAPTAQRKECFNFSKGIDECPTGSFCVMSAGTSDDICKPFPTTAVKHLEFCNPKLQKPCLLSSEYCDRYSQLSGNNFVCGTKEDFDSHDTRTNPF